MSYIQHIIENITKGNDPKCCDPVCVSDFVGGVVLFGKGFYSQFIMSNDFNYGNNIIIIV
jgi:hypothetical protein